MSIIYVINAILCEKKHATRRTDVSQSRYSGNEGPRAACLHLAGITSVAIKTQKGKLAKLASYIATVPKAIKTALSLSRKK